MQTDAFHSPASTPAGETVNFRVDDKQIIRHLIYAQAGSVVKAICELVQNSIDARASTVDITIGCTEHGAGTALVVEDDGCGFVSREEIDQCFATLGFDHGTAEQQAKGRRIGHYGLGRAQIMAHAVTDWYTNAFHLHVDLKESEDLAFTVREADRVLHRGCRIEAQLYRAMTLYEMQLLKRDLGRTLRYVDTSLRLNGEELTARDVSWSHSDEDLRFLHRPDSRSGVEVYNMGVYVKTYPTSQCGGVSGVLVAHNQPFRLNMARNDILVSEDSLWPRAKEIFKRFAGKGRSRTDGEREAAVIEQLSGEGAPPHEFYRDRVFRDGRGRTASLKMMFEHAEGRVTVLPSTRDSSVGEMVHDLKRAFVLHPGVMGLLDVDTLDAAVATLNGLMPFRGRVLEAEPFDEATKGLDLSAKHLIPPKSYTKTQQAMVNATQPVLDLLVGTVQRLNGWPRRARTLCLFDSGPEASVLAYTDGTSYVAVRDSELAEAFRSAAAMSRLVMLLAHEACHDESSEDSHSHGYEFYERFHDLLLSARTDLSVTRLVNMLATDYLRERRKRGLTVTSHRVARLESDAAEPAGFEG
ncbi:MAG TPA: hypothetical protein DD491_03425 [Halieaceae bacterium]|nr:hypothetical protein [Halieaceae bacterium]